MLHTREKNSHSPLMSDSAVLENDDYSHQPPTPDPNPGTTDNCLCPSKTIALGENVGILQRRRERKLSGPSTSCCRCGSHKAQLDERLEVQTDRGLSSWRVRLRTYLLAGELAEHRGDVAGVLGHHPADGLLHRGGNAARHAGHDLLQLQQWQRRVPEGPQQLLHPVLQLRWDQSVGLRPAGAWVQPPSTGWAVLHTLSRPGPMHSSSQRSRPGSLWNSPGWNGPGHGGEQHPPGLPARFPHPGWPHCPPCASKLPAWCRVRTSEFATHRCLWDACFVPDTFGGPKLTCSHLILRNNLGSRYNWYSHFLFEDTETEIN